MIRALLSLTLALAVLVGARVVVAAPTASASPAARTVARDHFQRAEAEFAAGRYGEALVEYRIAYDAVPEPSLLFNIAQCHRALAQYRPAIEALRAYLAARGDRPAPASGRTGAVCVTTPCIEALIDELARRERALSPPDLRPREAPPSPIVTAVAAPAPPPRRRPIYRRWWFITGAVVVVAAGAAGGYLALRGDRCGGADLCFGR